MSTEFLSSTDLKHLKSNLHPWRNQDMPDFAQPHCYYIPRDQGPEAEDLGYIPSLVFANESGHFPMAGDPTQMQIPWRWGQYEQACHIADQENKKLGINPRRAALIIAASMGLQNQGV